MNFQHRPPARHQPVFNMPGVVTGLIGVLLVIHAIRVFALSPEADEKVLLALAFIPGRISDPGLLAGLAPGGQAAAVWSFVTYALLHADWGHVILNSIWLAAFGAPVARRFGPRRFLIFSAAGAVGGALLHLVTNFGEMSFLIGASAAVSAMMAGAARFAFFDRGFAGTGAATYLPAPPLSVLFSSPRVLGFIGIWFAINLVFGFIGSTGLADGNIAWQAHIGGFAAGLFLFPLFDPVPRGPSSLFPPYDRDVA
jgi:membrane associated rhomboid family serine protease